MSSACSLYIDLIKKCLAGQIADPRRGAPIISLESCVAQLQSANEMFKPYMAPMGQTVESFLAATSGWEKFDAEALQAWLNHMHRDLTPDTMSDIATIENLQSCVEDVIKNGVAGDLIETGIWKGGLPLLMRAILKAHDITDRVVWAADSFEGLPEPNPRKSLNEAIWFHLFALLDHLGIPFEFVEGVFRKYDLLDAQVRFLKGWFSDTLPSAPIEKLAVMRLDGDWYESTSTALNALYPKLSQGGYVIIDDYGLPFGCRRAVDEYRHMRKITEPIQWVNQHVVCWQKKQ